MLDSSHLNLVGVGTSQSGWKAMWSKLPVDALSGVAGYAPLIALAVGLLVAAALLFDHWRHRGRRLRRSVTKLSAENAALRAELAQQERYAEADRQSLAEAETRLGELRERCQGLAGTAQQVEAQLALRTDSQRELERRLVQAHKMEALSRLAGGLAHEFGNLMAIITGYADLALTDPSLSARVHGDFAAVKQAAAHAAELSDQLLAIGRAHARQDAPLDLNRSITNLQEMLYHVLGAQIRMETRLDPELVSVQGDGGEVAQVLLTLALHAADAMDEGGRLLFRTANAHLEQLHACEFGTLPPGDYALLAVHHTGRIADWPRVAADLRGGASGAAAAEPSSPSRELAICREIITRAGGHIHAELEPAAGATFSVYWPTAPDLRGRPAPDVRRERRGLATVLLVETEASTADLAQEILSLEGYQVLRTADAEEALGLAAEMQGSIDVLVTALALPGWSGTELAAQLEERCLGLRTIYLADPEGAGPHAGDDLPTGATVLTHAEVAEDLAEAVRALLEPERAG